MARLTCRRAAPGAFAEAKPTGYYGNAREDLVAALPRPLGRVLDIGRDIVAAVDASGWRVLQSSHPALCRGRLLNLVTRWRSTGFLIGQWYVLAEAGASGDGPR